MSRRMPWIAAALLVAVIAGAAVADRLAPADPQPFGRVDAVTPGGVWTCPFVSAGKGGGTLSLANAAVEPSAIRIRWVRPPLKSAEVGLTLAGGRAVALNAPPSGDTQVGAIVEWAGGEVVASRSASERLPSGRPVAMGAACSRAGEPTLAATGLRTLGAESSLALLNPSSADALVDISVFFDGEEVAPESLTRRTVPARGRIAVRLGDFAFDRGGLGVVVRTTTGAVVADALVVSSRGAALVPLTPPRRSGVAAGFSLGAARVEVAAIGEDPATLTASTLTGTTRGSTRGFPAGLDGMTPSGAALAGAGPVAVALDGRDGPGFVGGLGFAVPAAGGGDFASTPVAGVATRWIGVAGPPATGKTMRVLVANPGSAPVTVRARVLPSAGGPAPSSGVHTVPGGRVVAFFLGDARTTVGVEVLATAEVTVALVASAGSGANTVLYGVGAVPAVRRPAPGVAVDPRAGVPARD